MALDGILIAGIASELREYLPMRINKISEVSSSTILFNIHAKNKRTNLIVSTHAQFNRISLSNKNYTTFDAPNGFTMLLRKYLINGIITEIEQKEYDRYLLLKVKAKDELYDDRHFILSIELMGKYANIILVDEDNGKIMDALKRIPPFENSKRTVLAGAKFELIESQHKKDPFLATSFNANSSLVEQFSGFSKLLEQEVLYRLNKGESFQTIMHTIAKSKKIYISKTTNKTEFHLIPLLHLSVPYREEEIFEAFDELYFDNEEKEKIKTLSADIYKFVKRQMKHYSNKIAKLSESKANSLHAQDDKINGELLFTYADTTIKGISELSLLDYEGREHLIELNPKLSIKENANKYFQNYQKKRKSIVYIDEQLQIAQNEYEYFNALNDQLTYANFLDATDIKNDLINNGYLKEKNNKVKKNKKNKIHLYQIKYKDALITFGKNNIQNDYLTFKYAKPNCTWFHAQKLHGAHVIVDKEEPAEDIIRFCANIAAYFSEGRLSGSVPVDYCRIKDVKKIKGSKPGFVSINHQKTIYIDPSLDTSLKIEAI